MRSTQTKTNNPPKREWESEPDKYEGEFCGIKFRIKRMPTSGHLCGYITLKNTKLEELTQTSMWKKLSEAAHGGITFSEQQKEDAIIGYDCAHYTDTMPILVTEHSMPEINTTYKNLAYNIFTCKKMCWIAAGNNLDTELQQGLFEQYANKE